MVGAALALGLGLSTAYPAFAADTATTASVESCEWSLAGPTLDSDREGQYISYGSRGECEDHVSYVISVDLQQYTLGGNYAVVETQSDAGVSQYPAVYGVSPHCTSNEKKTYHVFATVPAEPTPHVVVGRDVELPCDF